MPDCATCYKSLKSEKAYHVSTIKQEGSIDQLSAPGASALTSSSFPSLTEFSANATGESLTWTDLEQKVVSHHVHLILNMVIRSFSLSRKLMDLAVVYGHVVC